MNLVIIFTSGANYNDGGIGPGAYRLNDLSAIHIFDGVVNQIKNHLNDQLRINVGKDKVFTAGHTNGVFLLFLLMCFSASETTSSMSSIP